MAVVRATLYGFMIRLTVEISYQAGIRADIMTLVIQ